MPAPREIPDRDDHIVQLQVRRLIESHGELQGRGVFGPGNQAHLVRGGLTLTVSSDDTGLNADGHDDSHR
jgi:hypothetical protein